MVKPVAGSMASFVKRPFSFPYEAACIVRVLESGYYTNHMLFKEKSIFNIQTTLMSMPDAPSLTSAPDNSVGPNV